MRRGLLAIAITAVLVLSLVATGAVATSADSGIMDIDGDHAIASETGISDYKGNGVATAELEQLDATLTVADDLEDVDVDRRDAITDPQLLNSYLRIEYREDIDRTLRLWIPAEMITPYERYGEESLTSSHSADLSPVRDRSYLEVIVHVGGESDVVIPLSSTAAVVEGSINERIEQIDQALGGWVSGSDEWIYLENLDEEESIIELEADPDNVLIQYDTVDQDSERWINVPEGQVRGMPIYYHPQDNGSIILINVADEPIDVRYTEEKTLRDEATGWVNDARSALEDLPDRIRDIVPDVASTGGL